MKALRRPHWLSAETFTELLKREAPLLRCKHCNAAEDLSVDHILARYDGGTDDLDNLQILCCRCNSIKGTRPDKHWGKSFYWDVLPSPDGRTKLRAAQADLLEEITSDPYQHFCRPISDIARLLYLCAWVVGAGKTIGIAIAAWSFNFVVLKERGKVRRADRVLVFCKDEAIRDQIAHDLAADLVSAGITACPPRIGIIRTSDQFFQQEWLDSHDVVCACIQQLWQKDTLRSDAPKILASFPLIVFDEPHFAPDRTACLVDIATSSLCIGFTGTPIDNAGRLLKRMIKLSTYTYQDAVELDDSLKCLNDNPDHFLTFVRELDIHDANLTLHGQPTIVTDTNTDGYDLNIKPAEAVCGAVVQELMASDRLTLPDEGQAIHRDKPETRVDQTYPRHAIVYFKDISSAEHTAVTVNQWFKADRLLFPREKGWHVEVVHSGDGDADPKPLAPTNGKGPHPWKRAYETGRLDAKCARILFCIGMAREGVNNPYCGLTGVACSVRSLFAPIQGWIGRQLRAVVRRSDGVLHVPPAPLDTVRLITHKAFDNIETIQAGIKFLYNMEEHFRNLPGIESLADIQTLKPKDPDVISPPLSRREKLQVLCWFIEREKTGVETGEDDIVKVWAPQPGPRADRVRQWAKVCVGKNPDELRRGLRLDEGIKPLPTVRSERLKYDPNDDDLNRFIKTHHPDLSHLLPMNNDVRQVAVKLYSQHAQRFQLPRLEATTSINILARQIAGSVLADLGKYFVGKQGDVFARATLAVRLKLDVPRDQKLKNNTDWDTPETHALIRLADTQNELVRWIIARVIEDGSCPQLEAVLGV